jgi:hypothetical protein
MMKITATARTAKPAISSVRIPLAGSAAGRLRYGMGGAEPLAEGSGSVLAVPCGATGPVMALLRSKADWLAQAVAGSLAGRPRCR